MLQQIVQSCSQLSQSLSRADVHQEQQLLQTNQQVQQQEQQQEQQDAPVFWGCVHSLLGTHGTSAARHLGQHPDLLAEWLDCQLGVLQAANVACTAAVSFPSSAVMELWQCYKVSE